MTARTALRCVRRCDAKGSRLEKIKIYLFLRLFYLIKSSPYCLLAARDVPQVAFPFGAPVPYGRCPKKGGGDGDGGDGDGGDGDGGGGDGNQGDGKAPLPPMYRL